MSTIDLMDALLIIVAILFAVVLLFRYAIPPKKPKRSLLERLTEKGLSMRIELLGKRCSFTEHGFGVSYSGIGFKKIYANIEKQLRDGILIDSWEIELYNAKESVSNALNTAKAAMRLSYTYGHVNGYPRVYLLADELVCSTQCCITKNVLDKALAEFEKNAPLDNREKKVLPDIVRFCLCSVLYRFAEREQKNAKRYSKGINDGHDSKVDLDSIADCDYVCGLTETATQDAESIMRLLEENGVDVSNASKHRRSRLAEMYAVTRAVIDSLKELNEYMPSLNENCEAPNRLSKCIVMFCNIAPIPVIALCAVLTCVFVPARYVAIVSVVSSIVYAAFRLPVLIYAPHGNTFDVIKFIKSHIRRSQSVKAREEQLSVSRNMAETAYFGGEVQYIQNTISLKNLEIQCDNRGKILVSCINGREKFAIYLSVQTNTGELGLSEADVVFEPYRSIYRAVNACAELSVEITAPPEDEKCCLRTSVINRMAETQIFTVRVLCLPEFDIGRCETTRTKFGAALCYGEGVISLAIDGKAEYGGDLNKAFGHSHELSLGQSTTPAVIGVTLCECSGLSKIDRNIIAAHGKFIREIERLTEQASDSRLSEFDTDMTREFCILGKHRIPESKRLECGLDMSFKEQNNLFDAHRLDRPFTALSLDGGGFLNDGRFIMVDGLPYVNDNYVNLHGNGDMALVCTQNGVQSMLSWQSDSRNALERAADMPNAYLVLSENDIIWSPTMQPLGKGESYVVYGFGYTEYKCAYNGTVVFLKCGYIDSANAVVFDLTIQNTENIDRQINIAFMINGHGFKDIVRDCESVALIGDDVNYFISVSEPILDFCKYKEGYYERGKISRTSNFREGGQTLYPSVSVQSNIAENGTRRILFVVSKTEYKLVNESFADRAWLGQDKYVRKFDRVVLKTDDMYLNFFYKWSLYNAFVKFNTECERQLDIKREAIYLSAVKYVDCMLARRRIIHILSHQNYNGAFCENNAEHLYIACAVLDYVEFTQDFAFLDKVVSYLPTKTAGVTVSRSQTVLQHCLKAIDASMSIFYKNDGDIVCAVCRDEALIKLLHKFIDLCKPSDDRRKKFIRALCVVAARHSKNKKILISSINRKAYGFTDAIIYARALYISGEYGRAYDVLKCNNPIERFKLGKPNCTENDGDIGYPLFYITVTEMLLGLRFGGNRINISPLIDDNAPDIEFDLSNGDNNVHIKVENGFGGEWRMKADTISYSVSCLNLNDKKGANVILYRNEKVS